MVFLPLSEYVEPRSPMLYGTSHLILDLVDHFYKGLRPKSSPFGHVGFLFTSQGSNIGASIHRRGR